VGQGGPHAKVGEEQKGKKKKKKKQLTPWGTGGEKPGVWKKGKERFEKQARKDKTSLGTSMGVSLSAPWGERNIGNKNKGIGGGVHTGGKRVENRKNKKCKKVVGR